MHPIEQKIVKSFHFVKRDIEQLQKAYLASDKTQTKMLETIAAQDKLVKKQAEVIDDLKVRVAGLEKASTKHNAESKQKFKKEQKEHVELRKALKENQKTATKASKDVERLTAKLTKASLTKKAVAKKKTGKKK